jgi:hypothetical protein
VLWKERPWRTEEVAGDGKLRKWELKQDERHKSCNVGKEGNEDRK